MATESPVRRLLGVRALMAPAPAAGSGSTGGWAAVRMANGAIPTEALFREHALELTRLSLLLVGEKEMAADVVQEAFLALQRNWHRIRDEEKALPYLRSCVLNGSRSALRRRRVAREVVWPFPVDVESAESTALLRVEHAAVLTAVLRLPARQREVLVLRYWADLSERDIAVALGVRVGTVKSAASRGLAALARQVGSRDD